MFYRQISDELKLALTIPAFAEELFALTDQNREYLREWLPWLDFTRHVSDTHSFIASVMQGWAEGTQLHTTLFYQDKMVGVIGFNRIKASIQTGYVGYWLAQSANGKGLMTQATQAFLTLGFDELDLKKIEIACAVGNQKSRAIPERLGFKTEGTIRQAEKLYEQVVDHVIYGMLKSEYLENQKT